MSNDTTGVMWKRLRNLLSPQLDIYRHIAKHVEDKDVLEVGFGTGLGTLQLAWLAQSVCAVEMDADAVKFAKYVLPVGVDWQELDITSRRNNLPSENYDVIVCIETLEHIPDSDEAIEQIYRLLRPGGVAYITSPNANADLRKTDLHEREWTAVEFVDAMSAHFDEVQLFDYTLTKPQGLDTTITPLLAVCQKRNS